MTVKKKSMSLFYYLAIGVVMIIAAVLSGGHYIYLIIPVGCSVCIFGIISTMLCRKDKNMARECDEREMNITGKAMNFSFYFMALVLTAYLAYDIAKSGNLLSIPALLYYCLWGSFVIAYLYIRRQF